MRVLLRTHFFAACEDPAALAGGVGSPACCRQSCRHWFPAGPQAGWTAGRKPELFLSGPNIVGLAFTPTRSLIVATSSSLYRVDVGIRGRPLP